MWTHHVAALSAHCRIYAPDIIGDAGFSVNRREISKPDDPVNWRDEVFTVLVPEGQFSLTGISCRHPELGRCVQTTESNRRVVRNERVLQERDSDPSGPNVLR